MASRRPTAEEIQVHQLALARKDRVRLPTHLWLYHLFQLNLWQPLVDKDISAIIPDPKARIDAMNFLTSLVRAPDRRHNLHASHVAQGLFKVLQDKKQVQWKVLTKQETDMCVLMHALCLAVVVKAK